MTRRGRLRLRSRAVLIAWAFWAVAVPSRAADFVFWYGNTGRLDQAIQDLCDAFNTVQREDRVSCQGQGSFEGVMQKAVAAYRAGKQPAILQGYDFGTLDLLMSDAFLPVQSLLGGSGANVKDLGFTPAATGLAATRGGTLFSLPFNGSTLVLYSSNEMLAEAGVHSVPETWDAFERVLVALKQTGHSCPFAFDFDAWRYLEEISTIEGEPIASLLNGQGGLGAELLDTHAIHRRFVADLMRWFKMGLARDVADLGLDHVSRAFMSGRCAMVLSSTGSWDAIRSATQGHFTPSVNLVPHYGDRLRHASLIGGASLYVFKGFNADVYEGVRRFLSFLMRTDSQMDFITKTGYLPLTKDAVQAVKAQTHDKNDAMAAALVGLRSMDFPPGPSPILLGFRLQIRRIWREEMETVFAGWRDLDTGLERVRARGNRMLRRFERLYSDDAPGVSSHLSAR